MKFSRSEIVQKAFDCCIDAIKSYGPSTLKDHDRKSLIECMEHFKKLYEKHCEDEKS